MDRNTDVDTNVDMENEMRIINESIAAIEAHADDQGDGKWFEELVVACGPLIRDWDLQHLWLWMDWPDRKQHGYGGDTGIDVVGERFDGGLVCIQCKAYSSGHRIGTESVAKLVFDMGEDSVWKEHWMVVNRDASPTRNAQKALDRKKDSTVSWVSMYERLIAERELRRQAVLYAPDTDIQSKDWMQFEVVDSCVRQLLREYRENAEKEGFYGARGRLILPCGTGKTRIALRIMERLAEADGVSAVLCPSIALVAQIRREFMAHAAGGAGVEALAVCSDPTVVDPVKDEDRHASKPGVTDDSGYMSVDALTGDVTTDVDEIAAWLLGGDAADGDVSADSYEFDGGEVGEGRIKQDQENADSDDCSFDGRASKNIDIRAGTKKTKTAPEPKRRRVVFGTYQSAHKLGEALCKSGVRLEVLVCDEAHRTARVRMPKHEADVSALREFTVCHDGERFPAKYRLYQTATPRIYAAADRRRAEGRGYLVRDMDDQETFGRELERRSYRDAVENGWLSDYRIIAIVCNDDDVTEQANQLAQVIRLPKGHGKGLKLGVRDYVKGLTLALVLAQSVKVGGAEDDGGESGEEGIEPDRKDVSSADCSFDDVRLQENENVENLAGQESKNDAIFEEDCSFDNDDQDLGDDRAGIKIRSCIGFLNTVANSKAMCEALKHESTKEWLKERVGDSRSVDYTVAHLDASSSVAIRDAAKADLANGTHECAHAILNVGIFGEGTDAPSLSSVAFLEPRKSPIDVVQAVGRVMRRSEGKDVGYIIVPLSVPQDVVAEEWLMTSSPEEGWEELGQVLCALRSHDKRIEDELPNKMTLIAPSEAVAVESLLAVQKAGKDKAQKYLYRGLENDAYDLAEKLASGEITDKDLNARLGKKGKKGVLHRFQSVTEMDELNMRPTRLLTACQDPASGKIEMRVKNIDQKIMDQKIMDRRLDIKKRDDLLEKAVFGLLNPQGKEEDGAPAIRRPRVAKEDAGQISLFDNPRFREFAQGIEVNLLSKSGLGANAVERDANILIDRVNDAAGYLARDGLRGVLDTQFNIKGSDRGDSTKIAALILLNATMLHERIAQGGWIAGVRPLDEIKGIVHDLPKEFWHDWDSILQEDFKVVLGPAAEILRCIERTRKTDGLTRTLLSCAQSASEIAEIYAQMGSDHAGMVYNAFMSDQQSDGAFFTRPSAAVLLSRLAIDACGDVEWGSGRGAENRIVDLACGSGTLLVAALQYVMESKGASDELRRKMVERGLVGLDINQVSLQLAASQLTAGTTNTEYRRMGLHLMPYGPQDSAKGKKKGMRCGSVELFLDEEVSKRRNEMDFRENVGSEDVWDGRDIEDAAESVVGARLVLMNPPFSARAKMGEKFSAEDKRALRERTDALYELAEKGRMDGFQVRYSLRPIFGAWGRPHLPAAGGDGICLSNDYVDRHIRFGGTFSVSEALSCGYDPVFE